LPGGLCRTVISVSDVAGSPVRSNKRLTFLTRGPRRRRALPASPLTSRRRHLSDVRGEYCGVIGRHHYRDVLIRRWWATTVRSSRLTPLLPSEYSSPNSAPGTRLHTPARFLPAIISLTSSCVIGDQPPRSRLGLIPPTACPYLHHLSSIYARRTKDGLLFYRAFGTKHRAPDISRARRA